MNTRSFGILAATCLATLALAACGSNETAEAPAASATTAAAAPGALVMGDDSGEYANDNECDDPRFVGAMAEGLLTDNIGKDATDCQKALDAGQISVNPLFATPANDAAIVYGDDQGSYANDGDCDDIRFTGDYAAQMIYIVDDIGHDASDCRAAVTAGTARWQGNTATPVRGIEVQ